MINLKGLRTKISAGFAGLPLGAISIAEILESPIVTDFIQSHPVFSMCYAGVTYLATHYFRDEAEVPVVEPVAPPAEDKEQLTLEQQLAEQIGGDFEYVEPEKD